jgi:hypothetical protein
MLAASLIALSTMEASAVVYARGVVRAGCVAAGGGAAVVRAPVVTAPGRPSWRCGRGASGGGRCSAQGVLTIMRTHQLNNLRVKYARQNDLGRATQFEATAKTNLVALLLAACDRAMATDLQ